ncbi:MAG: hypothetical protein WA109_02440, partial [Bellilinea sp.]
MSTNNRLKQTETAGNKIARFSAWAGVIVALALAGCSLGGGPVEPRVTVTTFAAATLAPSDTPLPTATATVTATPTET